MYSTLPHTFQHACFFIVIHLGGLTTTSNTCNATFRPSVHYKHVTSGWATGTAILILYQSTVTVTAVTDRGHHRPWATRDATFRPLIHHKRVTLGCATGIEILVLYQSIVTVTAVTNGVHYSSG